MTKGSSPGRGDEGRRGDHDRRELHPSRTLHSNFSNQKSLDTILTQGIHCFFLSAKIRIDVASHRAWFAGGLNKSPPSWYEQGYLDSAEACLCLHVLLTPPCLTRQKSQQCCLGRSIIILAACG